MFLSMTLYADKWAKNTPEKKQQAMNSAAALLRAVYPGVPIINDFVYYQAAYMLTAPYTVASSRISSQSVSASGVSQSFASGQKIEKRELLAPEVLFGMGDPSQQSASVSVGVIY